MAIRIIRLGSPRAATEGPRLGTVRRPPRGVRKAEMKAPAADCLIGLLAALSQHAHFSVGCYCENPERCHRSILREMLAEHGARFA